MKLYEVLCGPSTHATWSVIVRSVNFRAPDSNPGLGLIVGLKTGRLELGLAISGLDYKSVV